MFRDQDGLEDRIAAGRIAALLRLQPVAITIAPINSALLFLVLMEAAPTAVLGAWVAAIWATTALRAVIWLRHRNTAIDPGAAASITRQLTASALVSGLLWGLPGVFFFPADPIALQGFIVFVLGGMSAGAVATLAPLFPAFCAFVLPTLVPVVGRLLHEGLQGGPGFTVYCAMAAMGAIYLLALLAMGRSLSRILGQSLALQIEKSDHAESLARARRQAEAANLAKSEFLATVSHELRTPLNAVLGFCQLLECQVHGPLNNRRYLEYLEHIEVSGRHLMRLIDDLLALSNAGGRGLVLCEEEIVDLERFLAQCAALVEIRASLKRQRLSIASGDADIVLRADPERLRQIVLNVLSNAIKFTPEEGEISLSTARDAAGGLSIVVRDNGIGMSDQELRVAFETFGRADSSHTRTTGGAGLGLPLTASLMRLHQGETDIVSRPGAGTEVTLRFPPERVIERPSPASRERPVGKRTGVSAA